MTSHAAPPANPPRARPDEIDLARHVTDTWAAHKLATLVRLWGAGATASAIAVAIGGGLTRNGVLGKAHRMGLAGRPSPIKYGPIKRDASGAPKRPRQKKRLGGQRGLVETRQRTLEAITTRAAPPPPTEVREIAPQVRVRAEDRGRSCAWPIGDPKEKGFHFCGARPVVPGRSYCAPHDLASRKKAEEAA